MEKFHIYRKPKKRIFLYLFLIIFLLFSLVLTLFYFSQRTNWWGRAVGPTPKKGEVEVENSYLFASPLLARADGKEKIRVTIFILDSEGLGVWGKPVFLGQDEKLAINTIQAVTDDLGRAIFDLSSTTQGEYFLEARVDQLVLPQKVKISFR